MDDRIAYAPDVVGVGRLFLIALKLPPDAPDVPVTMPDSVTMFDHSRPDLTPPPPSLQGKGELPGDPRHQSGGLTPPSPSRSSGGHRPPSPSRGGVRHFYFRALKPAERARIRSEAEKMLQAVQKQYANVEIPFYGKAGDKARRELFELQHLTVGLQVPDIQGVDLDGKAFKLSDYRGKVVFLDFWAHW